MEKSVDDLAARWLAPETLGETERRILQSAVSRKVLARDTNISQAKASSTGDRLADSIARIGGSWGFILAFMAFLAVWIAANVWLLKQDQFDPYPFIFLNLILSTLAALQAPVIMMSQNRQSARDRIEATHDYEVNLKAEIEIMALHDKIDALRQREIVAMHAEVSMISERLERMESRLASSGR